MTDWDSIIASPHYAGKRIFPVTVEGVRVPSVVHETDAYSVLVVIPTPGSEDGAGYPGRLAPM